MNFYYFTFWFKCFDFRQEILIKICYCFSERFPWNGLEAK